MSSSAVQVRVSTLILHARHDEIVPFEAGDELERAIELAPLNESPQQLMRRRLKRCTARREAEHTSPAEAETRRTADEQNLRLDALLLPADKKK